MKLCIDCRWFQRMSPSDMGLEYAECGHPSAVMTDPPNLVTGKAREIPLRQSCRDHRNAVWSNDPCGPDGKYWEAAERGFT